jgi:polyribonucleotide nucleotidyltransferase
MNVDDTGEVYISATCQSDLDAAVARVEALTRDIEAGEVYLGTVTRLMNFGAFVELLPGKEGLLHISEISKHRVPKVDDVLSPGDNVLVIVKEIDDMKRVNLSRRRIMADEAKIKEAGLESFMETENEREREIEKIAESSKGKEPDREDKNRDRNSRGRGPRRSSSNDRKKNQ